MDCLGSETVALYVAGGLTPGLRARADAHVDRCPACRTWIARAARMATRDGNGSTTDAGRVWQSPCPTPGTLLGRYRVEGIVGRGAMGIVLRAQDPMLGRAVALKLLHRAVDDESTHQALLAEARSLARLSDPHVVQVFDVGTWCGRLFLAMELVDGASLRQTCAQRTYPRRERLRMLVAAGRGLAAAHAARIVHRDFKPDNVLVANDGRVLVGDFGLALVSATDRTQDSDLDADDELVVGTPAYMAPEQRAGADVDGRADQFAFCVTAVELLVGWRPRAIDSRRAAAELAAHARSLPRPLLAALTKGLCVDPRRRHATMEALLIALERGVPQRWPLVIATAGLVGAVAWSWTPERPPAPVHPVAQLAAHDTSSAAIGLSHALRAASTMALRADDAATSRRLLDAAVEQARIAGDPATLVAALLARGKLEGDEPNAIADLEEAHALARRERLDREASEVAIVLARKQASHPERVDEALQWLRQAESTTSAGSIHSARIESTRARVAILRGDLSEATTRIDAALALFARSREPDDVERLLTAHGDHVDRGDRIAADEVFDDIVETWCIVGRCPRSAVASRRMLERMLDEYGPDDRGVAYARIRLAYHLFSTAQLDESRRQLEAAIVVLELQAAAQPFMLALALQRLSTLHHATGDAQRALVLGRRAVALVEDAYGRDSPNFATALMQLASVERSAGELADARHHLEWALVAAEQSFGPTHPMTAIVLTELATLARARGDRSAAAIASERSMQLHEARGSGSPDYATVLGVRAWAILPDDPATARTMLQRQLAMFAEMRASTGNPAIFTEEELVARRDLEEAQRRARG